MQFKNNATAIQLMESKFTRATFWFINLIYIFHVSQKSENLFFYIFESFIPVSLWSFVVFRFEIDVSISLFNSKISYVFKKEILHRLLPSTTNPRFLLLVSNLFHLIIWTNFKSVKMLRHILTVITTGPRMTEAVIFKATPSLVDLKLVVNSE